MAHIEPTREQDPSVDGPLQLDVRGGEEEEIGRRRTLNCNTTFGRVLNSAQTRSRSSLSLGLNCNLRRVYYELEILWHSMDDFKV
jgi:hypothetical protein